MPDTRRFRSDLEELAKRIERRGGLPTGRLRPLIDRLTDLYIAGAVKINHSAMELVIAAHLIMKGYQVDVEVKVNDIRCDVMGTNGGKVIVEVETGFVPPDHALDPDSFCRARIASKIARYSQHADRFYLAAPPTYLMEIPPFLLTPPHARSEIELRKWKELLDRYYRNPPIPMELLRRAKLNGILVTYVDEGRVIELSTEAYLNLFKYI
ncbi:MAG: hypothetical protein QI197_05640 [Candidatus Korarchaeota archaeon]|nr:hypothetical protein [Candidatus Korarchaeota archaeon]